MAKQNIEKDLLKILKRKNESEIFYVVLNMINDTYKYEIEYLNKVSHNVLMVYLEKIIAIIISQDLFVDLSNEESRLQFYDILQELKLKDLKANPKVNMQYFMKLRSAEIKNFLSKKKNQAILGVSACFIIAFLVVGFSAKKSNDNHNIKKSEHTTEEELNDEILIDLEDTFDNEETLEQEVPTGIAVDEVSSILEEYNLTQEQFDVLCAIVLSEAKGNSYEDAYAVINTIYNRTISRKWVDYISEIYNDEVGDNLYYQATAPDQFVVYQDKVYLRNLGIKEGPAYDAIIDFLLTKELKHNYLSFRANYCDVEGSEQLTEGGNKYFNELEDEDRINLNGPNL